MLKLCFVLLLCILAGIKKTSETQVINSEILLQVPNGKDISIDKLSELDLIEVIASHAGNCKPKINYKSPILKLSGNSLVLSFIYRQRLRI